MSIKVTRIKTNYIIIVSRSGYKQKMLMNIHVLYKSLKTPYKELRNLLRIISRLRPRYICFMSMKWLTILFIPVHFLLCFFDHGWFVSSVGIFMYRFVFFCYISCIVCLPFIILKKKRPKKNYTFFLIFKMNF